MKNIINAKNVSKEECEVCGKFFEYKYMRLEHTVDGDLLVCSACYNKIKNEKKRTATPSDLD